MLKVLRELKRTGNSRGQSLVELAIILPILVILLSGIFEFGRIFSSYLIMENLARDAARYGVVGHSDSEIVAHIQAQNPVLEESNLGVTITPADTVRVRGDALTVRLNYSVDLVAPFISAWLPDPFPLETSCTMMVE